MTPEMSEMGCYASTSDNLWLTAVLFLLQSSQNLKKRLFYFAKFRCSTRQKKFFLPFCVTNLQKWPNLDGNHVFFRVFSHERGPGALRISFFCNFKLVWKSNEGKSKWKECSTWEFVECLYAESQTNHIIYHFSFFICHKR